MQLLFAGEGVGRRGWRLKLDVTDEGDRKMLDVDGQGGWVVLKIRQFSWTSYVYRSLRILMYSVRNVKMRNRKQCSANISIFMYK